MYFLAVTNQNREQINTLIKDRWFTTEMIIRGEIVDMTAVEGVAAMHDNEIMGLITYRISNKVCEITSLDSLREGQGIGTALLAQVIVIAREKNCHKLSVITTNDNVMAIRFHQKRGFDLVKVHLEAVTHSRILKPEIPLAGQNGIPIKHELEFELLLGNSELK